LGENLFGCFLRGSSHARPPTSYLRQLPLDFLPWTLLWPVVAAAAPGRASGDRGFGWRLLACWIGAALLFFSASAGQRGLYLIPIFPALALLCADALVARLPRRGRMPGWLVALALALVATLLAAVALLPALLARHGLAAPAGAGTALAAFAALRAAALAALRGGAAARGRLGARRAGRRRPGERRAAGAASARPREVAAPRRARRGRPGRPGGDGAGLARRRPALLRRAPGTARRDAGRARRV